MSDTALARIESAEPGVTQWTGAVGTDPIAAGTPDYLKRLLAFGEIEAGANSNALAVSLDFSANFDDSIWSKVKVWCSDLPGFTEHSWKARLARTQSFPAAALTNPITAGVDLPGSGFYPLTGTASGAASAGADVYNATTKRIQTLLLQLQTGAGATIYDQLASIFRAPLLRIEAPRTDKHAGMLITDLPNFDLETGHNMLFSDVEVFKVVGSGSSERWLSLGPIKDENVSLNNEETHTEWMKFKPQMVIQRARSSFVSELTFTLDEVNPNIWAQSLQTTPVVDLDREVVRITHNAKLSRVIESKFVIQFRTLGMFLCRAVVERGVLTPGSLSPGAQEFAGREFTLSGLAKVDGRNVMDYEISLTPVEQAMIPLTYSVIEPASA